MIACAVLGRVVGENGRERCVGEESLLLILMMMRRV